MLNIAASGFHTGPDPSTTASPLVFVPRVNLTEAGISIVPNSSVSMFEISAVVLAYIIAIWYANLSVGKQVLSY